MVVAAAWSSGDLMELGDQVLSRHQHRVAKQYNFPGRETAVLGVAPLEVLAVLAVCVGSESGRSQFMQDYNRHKAPSRLLRDENGSVRVSRGEASETLRFSEPLKGYGEPEIEQCATGRLPSGLPAPSARAHWGPLGTRQPSGI